MVDYYLLYILYRTPRGTMDKTHPSVSDKFFLVKVPFRSKAFQNAGVSV